ncbi:MAG: type II/IV secretion system protein, partial [Planctomycetota bacterium]
KGIFELMLVDDDLRELILERSSASKIKRLGIEHGMIVLRDDGWIKVRNGITTISEVVRATKG